MKYHIALLTLLLNIPAASYGDKIPKELSRELIQKFEQLLCKDSKFTECIGIEKSICSNKISSVLNGCDYSPVWKEIENMNHEQANKVSTSDNSMKYAECVISRFQEQFSIHNTVFEQCVDEHL